jgi:hypothetical protein
LRYFPPGPQGQPRVGLFGGHEIQENRAPGGGFRLGRHFRGYLGLLILRHGLALLGYFGFLGRHGGLFPGYILLGLGHFLLFFRHRGFLGRDFGFPLGQARPVPGPCLRLA